VENPSAKDNFGESCGKVNGRLAITASYFGLKVRRCPRRLKPRSLCVCATSGLKWRQSNVRAEALTIRIGRPVFKPYAILSTRRGSLRIDGAANSRFPHFTQQRNASPSPGFGTLHACDDWVDLAHEFIWNRPAVTGHLADVHGNPEVLAASST
jgi:hypothetical protein